MTAPKAKPDPIDAVAAEARKEQRDAATAATKADAKTAGDAKPKRGGTRSPAGGRPRGAKTGTGAANLAGLDTRLAELFGLIGLTVATVNAEDGAVIIANAEPLAKALHALAKENPAVRRVLLGLLQTSAVGGVIMAAMPIVVGIMANHGKLPPAMAAFSGVTPTTTTPGGTNGNGTVDADAIANLLG